MGVAVQHADGWEYMLTKTVLDPKEDGTYDQATMYVTFVFGTP